MRVRLTLYAALVSAATLTLVGCTQDASTLKHAHDYAAGHTYGNVTSAPPAAPPKLSSSRLTGDGFSIALPEGWHIGKHRDNRVYLQSPCGAEEIFVEGPTARAATAGDFALRLIRKNRADGGHLATPPIVGVTLDREPTLQYTLDGDQRQVVAVHNGGGYVLSLASGPYCTENVDAVLEAVAGSWRWA